jgi:hypothetical protein
VAVVVAADNERWSVAVNSYSPAPPRRVRLQAFKGWAPPRQRPSPPLGSLQQREHRISDAPSWRTRQALHASGDAERRDARLQSRRRREGLSPRRRREQLVKATSAAHRTSEDPPCAPLEDAHVAGTSIRLDPNPVPDGRARSVRSTEPRLTAHFARERHRTSRWPNVVRSLSKNGIRNATGTPHLRESAMDRNFERGGVAQPTRAVVGTRLSTSAHGEPAAISSLTTTALEPRCRPRAAQPHGAQVGTLPALSCSPVHPASFGAHASK